MYVVMGSLYGATRFLSPTITALRYGRRMINHIVIWKLKEEADGRSKAEIAAELKTQLEALPDLIPEIQALEIGPNVKAGEFAGDIALYSTFKSLEDLATYANHPEHLKVGAFLKGVVTERRVVDFEG
ncbi:MAG: hypothetical protein ACI9QL_000764 [Candidatus Omnitrophota bacterium]|jgi:hypothetical protein